jgi:O-antigen ligase
MNEDPNRTAPGFLGPLVAVHVALFVVGVSWAFGGNADWVRTPISAWGTVGMLLTLVLVAFPRNRSAPFAGALKWAWPVAALNLLVAASCLTPGLRVVASGGVQYFMPARVAWWIPSSANAGTSLRALWLFDGIYFSCLNVALAVRRKRILRALLAALAANALVLSVFGTIQKLLSSTGIFFGAVGSPQVHFFASFVYDNHWGAFIVLMTCATMGLVLRYADGSRGRGFFGGPALTGLVAACVMGVTVPLSGSRACTLLLGAVILVALVRGVPRVSRALHVSGVSSAGALAAMAAAVLAAGAGTWMVAGDVIHARAVKTKEQAEAMWVQGGMGSRSTLYHDTWRMARGRMLFGWGMGSFPTVFSLYNTQEPKSDRIPIVYHDAHSDWLQSAAEIGLFGTALIGAAVALPLAGVRRLRAAPIPYFMMTGCALIAAYAWVEFPFGNVAVVLAWWASFMVGVQYARLASLQAAGPHPA